MKNQYYFVILLSLTQLSFAFPNLVAEYRMDECFYLGGANGAASDISDSSSPNYPATSINTINSDHSNAKICRSAVFGNSGYARLDKTFKLKKKWSLSVWLHFPFVTSGKKYYVLGSYKNTGDLPAFRYDNDILSWGIYDNSGDLIWQSMDNNLVGWHHLVFKNNSKDNITKLFLDGEETNSINSSTKGKVTILWSSTDSLNRQSLAANMDEMKIFTGNLKSSEIQTIYNNENAGLNYDGSIRECQSCSGANISANSWDLISLPIETRNTPVTVNDVFASMSGVLNTNWFLYKRTYDPTNNSSNYEPLVSNSIVDFSKAYWLGSELDNRWDIAGLPLVNYDSCAGNCVEIPLTPVSLDFAIDPDDGSGSVRFNMTGYVNINKPVNWADCRFIVSDLEGNNRQVFTPSEAEVAGYAGKQIWQYNGAGDSASNSYNTCDDVGIGECKLIPLKGFWLELRGPTKGKLVKLQIPKS